jgi:hypothetical protein
MRNIILSSLLSILVLPVAFAGDEGGGKEGHGGDAYAQEFVVHAIQAAQYFPDRDALLRFIKEVRVITQDTLEVNGEEVDFIPYPDKKTLSVSRKAWDALPNEAERMSFAIKKYQYLLSSSQNAANADDTVKNALEAGRKSREFGATLLRNYIAKARKAVTLDQTEYATELNKIANGRAYKQCIGWHTFVTSSDEQACQILTDEIRAIPTFTRAKDGLTGREDRELTAYLRRLPEQSREQSLIGGWAVRIMLSYEKNAVPIATAFSGIKRLSDACMPRGIFFSPDPSCFVQVFTDEISGMKGAAIERARTNFEAEAQYVEKELERFLSE